MFVAKQNTSKMKRSILTIIGALCIFGSTLILSGCGAGFTWTPWTDLSQHYNLESIKHVNGSLFSINSHEYSFGKMPYASHHIDDREYNAIVLGTNVWIRSQPAVSYYTQRCQVQTGDKLTVRNSAGFVNGRYWSNVFINTGYSAGREGYVCTDFIIEQEQYEVLSRYVLNSGMGLSLKTESKYLHAIADILVKLNAHTHHPNLSVSIADIRTMGTNVIETFMIRNHNSSQNNTLLAVVQFFQGNNDYVVLAIVPGDRINNIMGSANGSYDIYFEKY